MTGGRRRLVCGVLERRLTANNHKPHQQTRLPEVIWKQAASPRTPRAGEWTRPPHALAAPTADESMHARTQPHSRCISQWAGTCPSKSAPSRGGGFGPLSDAWFLRPIPTLQPQPAHDRFRRFCTAHGSAQRRPRRLGLYYHTANVQHLCTVFPACTVTTMHFRHRQTDRQTDTVIVP